MWDGGSDSWISVLLILEYRISRQDLIIGKKFFIFFVSIAPSYLFLVFLLVMNREARRIINYFIVSFRVRKISFHC